MYTDEIGGSLGWQQHSSNSNQSILRSRWIPCTGGRGVYLYQHCMHLLHKQLIAFMHMHITYFRDASGIIGFLFYAVNCNTTGLWEIHRCRIKVVLITSYNKGQGQCQICCIPLGSETCNYQFPTRRYHSVGLGSRNYDWETRTNSSTRVYEICNFGVRRHPRTR